MFNSLGYSDSLISHDAPKPPGIIRNYLLAKRAFPKIFIVGAQKSGTTSLSTLLSQHPCILSPQLKEPFFFGNNQRYEKGLSFYLPNFPRVTTIRKTSKNVGQECMTFDATTNYFDHPQAAERIKSLVPDARIIIMLRNPVTRAHSHYKMFVRNGLEGLGFHTALIKEDARINEGVQLAHNYCRQRLGYRTRGQYAELLPPWLEVFDKERVHILCAEDFFADTPKAFAEVLSFLNLPPFQPLDFTPQNTSADKTPIDDASRQFLEIHFEKWNSKLQNMLGRTFPWKPGDLK